MVRVLPWNTHGHIGVCTDVKDKQTLHATGLNMSHPIGMEIVMKKMDLPMVREKEGPSSMSPAPDEKPFRATTPANFLHEHPASGVYMRMLCVYLCLHVCMYVWMRC